MIKVDEEDPIGELEAKFPYRDVQIRRGENIKDVYDLEGEIGRGKFGTVYRCREKSTKLSLAAKFVEIARRQDRKNVEREVEIMRTLQHPRLIQLYDAFETDNTMVLVLELIEGGELFERVIDDDFILTEKSCTVFMRQICEGVAFIHSNNIIHLDLKPENILCLTRTGNRIKIIDFGLARKFEPDKKLQVLFGTPEFVAPEVVNFDQISCATDMWSVGVICYVLLSGLSPFMGESDIETMSNVTLGKYDFEDDAFDEISKDAKDFISRLLVQKKEGRLTAKDCLSHPWLKRRSSVPNLATSKENMKNFVDNYVPIKTQAKLRQNVQDKNCPPIIQILDETHKKFTDLENSKNLIKIQANETIPAIKMEKTPEKPAIINKHCSDLINIINSIEPLNSADISGSTVVTSMSQVEPSNIELTNVETFKGVEKQEEIGKEDKTTEKFACQATANDGVDASQSEPAVGKVESKVTTVDPSLNKQGNVSPKELNLRKAVEDLPNLSKSILSSFTENTNSFTSTSSSVMIASKCTESVKSKETERKCLTRMHSVGDSFVSSLNQNLFPKILGVTLGKQIIDMGGGSITQHESNKINKVEIFESRKSEASTFKQHLKSSPPWFSELSNSHEQNDTRNRFERRSSDISLLHSGESSWMSDIKQFSARLFESTTDPTTLSWLNAKPNMTGDGHKRPKNKVSYLNRDVPLGSPPQNISGFREYHLGRLLTHHADTRSAPQSPRYSPDSHCSILRQVLTNEKEDHASFAQDSTIHKESRARLPLIETNSQS